MAIDVNSQFFSLAFAIVEGESNGTWSWFLNCIRQYVTKMDGLCVISDRYKGILHAINRVVKGWEEPYTFHRFCKRNLDRHTLFYYRDSLNRKRDDKVINIYSL